MSDWQTAKQFYIEQYQKAKPLLPGQDLSFVCDMREVGIKSFEAIGFPDRKHEEWKYTNVHPLLGEQFMSPELRSRSDECASDKSLSAIDAYSLIFVDGTLQEDRSILPEVSENHIICDLRTAFQQHPALVEEHLGQCAGTDQAFTALNSALMTNGYFIYLAPGAQLDKPVHVKFIQTCEQVSNFRNLVVANANASVAVIEHFASDNDIKYFTNTVTEVILSADASAAHTKLIQESSKSYHIGDVRVVADKASSFDSYSFALSGGVARSDSNITLADVHASCRLFGLYLGRDKSHIDHHTEVHHASKQCRSEENYKGIIADTSRAVFNGKVIVAKDAEQTVANQSNQNILLSSQAEIDTKPQLEIFNDDVVCTHGATIGELDEQALFYLQSRGIPRSEAKKLLLQAFAAEIIEKIEINTLKQLLLLEVDNTLSIMEEQ